MPGMSTHEIPITAASPAPSWPPDELVDEMVMSYVDWREDAAAVEPAYVWWSEAPSGEEAQSFAAYCAALDQEESAAATYALAVLKLQRVLWAAEAASEPAIHEG